MSTSYTVRFIEIGRMKLSWEETMVSPVTDHKLSRAIMRRKAVMSRDVWFDWKEHQPPTHKVGQIVVAGRVIGRFEIQAQSTE